MLTIGQLNRKYELEALLNNCTDDDEKILLKRELEGIEEVNNCLYCGVKLDLKHEVLING